MKKLLKLGICIVIGFSSAQASYGGTPAICLVEEDYVYTLSLLSIHGKQMVQQLWVTTSSNAPIDPKRASKAFAILMRKAQALKEAHVCAEIIVNTKEEENTGFH